MKFFLRHLVAGAAATGITFGLWFLLILPIMAVFVIDNAFTMPEFLLGLASIMGASFGITLFIFFPVALIGEWLVRKFKWAIWIFPLCVLFAASVLLLVRIILCDSVLQALLGWGVVAILAGVFTVYWVVLWVAEKGLVLFLNSLRNVARRRPCN